ncbi:hypothetical protein nublan001_17820 [Klebsiella pneumoniae]
MKNKIMMVFILIISMIICSCEKTITFAHRRQIIKLMHIDPISVHCVVITIQALNENGNHENSK